ncbi:hypothetical protein [Salipiger sp.]|uniref:hypothetical protein n=1 Tax=Salipiger sp. TaxID=2078585 RepID=UPI003A97D8C3
MLTNGTTTLDPRHSDSNRIHGVTLSGPHQLAWTCQRRIRVDCRKLARMAGADFPAVRCMQALGADHAEVLKPAPIHDMEAFRAEVVDLLETAHGRDPAFRSAREQHRVEVMRPGDFPDLGYQEPLSVAIYVKGICMGVWDGQARTRPFNHMLKQAIEATGTMQVFGSHEGHGFYAFWPDARLRAAG